MEESDRHAKVVAGAPFIGRRLREWRLEPPDSKERAGNGGWSPFCMEKTLRTEAGAPSLGRTLSVVAGAPWVHDAETEESTDRRQVWTEKRRLEPLFPSSRNRAQNAQPGERLTLECC